MALYKRLRMVLYSEDMTQKDLARILKKSESYVAVRMSGRYPFSMSDAYTTLDYFDLPHQNLCTYFPPKGKGEIEVKSLERIVEKRG